MKVCVHQHLELKLLGTLIAHLQFSLQGVLGQGYTVNKSELIGPCLAVLFAQHAVRQTEVQLDSLAIIRLSGGLSKVFPCGVASKAVLGKGGGSVVFGGRAEDLLMGEIY